MLEWLDRNVEFAEGFVDVESGDGGLVFIAIRLMDAEPVFAGHEESCALVSLALGGFLYGFFEDWDQKFNGLLALFNVPTQGFPARKSVNWLCAAKLHHGKPLIA